MNTVGMLASAMTPADTYLWTLPCSMPKRTYMDGNRCGARHVCLANSRREVFEIAAPERVTRWARADGPIMMASAPAEAKNGAPEGSGDDGGPPRRGHDQSMRKRSGGSHPDSGSRAAPRSAIAARPEHTNGERDARARAKRAASSDTP